MIVKIEQIARAVKEYKEVQEQNKHNKIQITAIIMIDEEDGEIWTDVLMPGEHKRYKSSSIVDIDNTLIRAYCQGIINSSLTVDNIIKALQNEYRCDFES